MTQSNIIPYVTALDFHDIIDQKTMFAYTNGLCNRLAAELHDLTKLPIYAVIFKDDTPGQCIVVPSHFVIQMPGGEYFMDVNGIYPISYHIQYWKQYYISEGEYNPQIFIVPINHITEYLLNDCFMLCDDSTRILANTIVSYIIKHNFI